MSGCQRNSSSQDIPGINVVSATVIRAHEKRSGWSQRVSDSLERHVAAGICRLREGDALPEEGKGACGFLGQSGVVCVSVGNQRTDSLLESGQHVGEDGPRDGGGCLGCLVVALGVQGGRLLSGKVVGALGNVDAVAEDDCGRKWGRGRGELGENATDFAL